MACVVDDCCGFIKLRNGCFIIGYLNLASTLYLICKSMIGILTADNLMQQNPSEPHNVAWIVGKAALTMYSVLLVVGLLELLFTILLLLGLHQYRRSFVKAHFIFNFIFLVIYAVGLTIYLASGNFFLMILMIDLFTICLTVYLLVVIRSYYIEMGKQVKPDNDSEAT